MSSPGCSVDDRDGTTTNASEYDAFPALGNDIFLTVAAELSLHDMASAVCVCRPWQALLDGTDRLWSALCERVWASKVYVPSSLRAMAEGASAVTAAEEKERRDLMSSRVRDLKDLMRSLQLQGGDFVEKGDFADAILDARRKVVEEGSPTERLLRLPLMLVRREAGESPPKAALRLSLADAKRTFITEEELVSLTFEVRLRRDGPLSEAIQFDPWWLHKGAGAVRFHPKVGAADTGSVSFTWPVDPDTGEQLDPFAALGMPLAEQGLEWSLPLRPGGHGRVIDLLIHGHPGPEELVCRHPRTWGWVLYSQGTCWTSWPMPKCEVVDECDSEGGLTRGVKRCSDPLLREEVLSELPCDLKRDH